MIKLEGGIDVDNLNSMTECTVGKKSLKLLKYLPRYLTSSEIIPI